MSAIVSIIDACTSAVRQKPQLCGLASQGSSERAVTYTAYLVFALCAVVVGVGFTDNDFSVILTSSAGVQCLGFFLLSSKVTRNKSVEGLSLKSLETYVAVLTLRLSSTLVKSGYLPVDQSGDWVYQVSDVGSLFIVMRLVYMMRKTLRNTYDEANDTLPILNFVPACFLLAFCIHGDLNASPIFDVLWMFSLLLDTVALLPQLWYLTTMGGEVEALTSHFVACMTLSRAMSFAFWFYGYEEVSPEHEFNAAGYLIVVAHLLQLFLSADFMYHYARSMLKQQSMVLPRMDV